jgi:hypothetical protein
VVIVFKRYLFFIIKILIVTGSINIVNEKLLYLPLLIIISFDIAKQFINKKINGEVIHTVYVILLLVNVVLELQGDYRFFKLFSSLVLFILYFIIEKIENKDDSD